MPESLGDLVALLLGLALMWLIPGRLWGWERPPQRQAAQRRIKAS